MASYPPFGDLPMKRLLAIACLLMIFGATQADTWSPPGPAVGTAFPDTLTLPDQAGKTQSLSALMGSRGAAVFFVRSADWCPYCKRQLAEANGKLAQFRALGLNVISVSHDSVDKLQPFFQAQNIGYTMLADADGKVVEKLGLRDLQYADGSKAYGVARPTLFIINRQGVITHKFAEQRYQDRPDLEQVLATLAKP